MTEVLKDATNKALTEKPIRIRKQDIPAIKEAIMREDQDYFCPLCGIHLMELSSKSRCLDHDHRKRTANAGGIRGVLCSNCNGMEGKINNAAVRASRGIPRENWLANLLDYWKKHATNQTGFIHPNHGKVQKRRKGRVL